MSIYKIPDDKSTVTIPLKEYERLVKRASDNESTRRIVVDGSEIISVYDSDNLLVHHLMDMIKKKDEKIWELQKECRELREKKGYKSFWIR